MKTSTSAIDFMNSDDNFRIGMISNRLGSFNFADFSADVFHDFAIEPAERVFRVSIFQFQEAKRNGLTLAEKMTKLLSTFNIAENSAA